MRKTTLFLLLLCSVLAVQGQKIAGYEYWLDTDYDKKITGNTSNGTITVTLDVSPLSEGIHFYNFRAKDGNGSWSVPLTQYFYRSSMNQIDNRITRYEYWLDGDYEHKQEVTSSTNSINLNLDVTTLCEGVHYLNFRAQDAKGLWSSPATQYFYRASTNQIDNRITNYEYWLDGNYSQKQKVSASTNIINLDVDVAALCEGIHYLNFRTQDAYGAWSSPLTQYFYRVPINPIVNKLVKYEYWFDKDFNVRKEASTPDGILNLDIDAASLREGVHYLNFRAQDAKGQWSNPLTKYFYRSPVSLGDNGIIAYEFWFDDEFNKRTVKNIEKTIRATILEEIDVLNVKNGKRIFHFCAVDSRGQRSIITSDTIEIYNRIELTTQADVEKYAHATIIGSDVVIKGEGIRSLQSLNKLETIGGRLIIEGTSLTDLAGLNNLQEIGGSLSLTANTKLSSLQGLNKLDRIGTDTCTISIVKNQALADFCELSDFAYKHPSLKVIISGNKNNPTWQDIIEGRCGSYANFMVEATSAVRTINAVYFTVTFSADLNKTTDYTRFVTWNSPSKKESMLKHITADGTKLHLYFERPTETGTYTLTISSQITDALGRKLDMNQNNISGEEADNYLYDTSIHAASLQVVKHYPLTGKEGVAGNTDIEFNTGLLNNTLPKNALTLTAPDGSPVEIEKISLKEGTTVPVYQIGYKALPVSGDYRLRILSDKISDSQGGSMDLDYEAILTTPSANLKLESVTLNSTDWEINTPQTLTYTIRNTGDKPIEGTWTDVVYLSSSPEWTSSAKEIYRGEISEKVAAAGSYQNQVSFTVPTAIEGVYYILVRCNADQKVAETDYSDNTQAGQNTITTRVEALVLNTAAKEIRLDRGEQKLYKLSLGSNQNVRISDSNGVIDMASAYSQFPDITNGAQKKDMLISCSTEGDYYILLSNNALSVEKEQICQLSLREFDLEISEVYADTLIRYQSALIPIEVIGCSELPSFALIGQDGKRTESSKVHIFSETLFSALLPVGSLTEGLYDLYVTCGDKGGMKSRAIYIKDSKPIESLKTKLILPSQSRIGTTVTAYVEYVNNGNVDIPAPLLILEGAKGSTYKVGESDTYTDEIHLMGLNAMGVLNRLRPGEGGRIEVQIGIPNVPVYSADYKLRVLSHKAKDMDQPFYLQWLGVDPNIKPTAYTQAEWDEYVKRLRGLTGETWDSFVEALNKIEGSLWDKNMATLDAKVVYSYLKELAYEHDEILSEQIIKKGLKAAEDVEPGTIFIWGNRQNWIPLVNYKNGEWERMENGCALFDPNKRTFFVSHGWNDDRNGDAAWGMAIALSTKFPNQCNIITVDWSKWSNTGFTGVFSTKNNLPIGLQILSILKRTPDITKTPIIGPAANAGYVIPEVAQRVYRNMCLSLMGSEQLKCILNNFHLIGHSHGAHVCGMLAEQFKRFGNIPERLSALDASNDLSHINPENEKGQGWQNCAKYMDYYKSSVLAGSESLHGDDNFILIKEKNGFIFTPWTDYDRHGYAITWYKKTLSKEYEGNLGFRSDASTLNKLWKGSRDKDQWHGVINGNQNKIECLSVRDELGINISKWNYTDPWYDKKEAFYFSDKKFRDALASTFELAVNDEQSIHVPDNEFKVGVGKQIDIYIDNRADNHTIPHEIREERVYDKIRHNLFLLPVENLSTTSTDPILQLRGIIDPEPAEPSHYYPTINITEEMWKNMGGSDQVDHIDCYLILKVGMDINGNPFTDYWKGELYTDNNTAKVKVRIIKSRIKCNAGVDIERKDGNSDGIESIYREGKATSERGKITEYGWYWNGKVISADPVLKFDFPVGTHTITFHVSDGVETATDEITIDIYPDDPPEGDPGDSGSTATAWSWDPNEKVGTKGAGSKDCVLPEETVDYTIFFENDPEKANAAAQEVRVIDVLDEAFDLSTFSFTGAIVANKQVSVPGHVAECSVITDLRPENNMLLRTNLKLDVDTRTITALFTSLDPETGEFTTDPWGGFLYPNDETHRGEGHFSYRVKLKKELQDGYEVKNLAKIYFDNNDPIVTNTTTHLIDLTKPVSFVEELPSQTTARSVRVNWQGADEGSGIRYYDIYLSDNGKEFVLWQEKTAKQEALFEGVQGHRYQFFSIATDSIGYSEPMKTKAEATILFGNDVVGNETISTEQTVLMNAFPNPVRRGEKCVLSFNIPEDKLRNYQISVYSMTGSLYQVIKQLIPETTLVDLEAGIYVITLSDKNNRPVQSVKLLVNK